jgi:hypothetical protein
MTDRRLRVSDQAVFRELDGEAVILNLESGTYFGLDRVGTRVWRLIEAHGRVDEVVRCMIDEFEVDPGTLERDVHDLVSAMVHKGLLVTVA